MDLYLIRHAWAERADESRWPDDRQRPLTKKGRKRFCKLVKHLIGTGWGVQHVATSPLVRCLQTAEIVSGELGDVPMSALDALAPSADDLGPLWEWSQALDAGSAAWVGHAPDVSHLAASLLGGEPRIEFPKGAMAAFRFEGLILPGAGRLCWLATAETLGI